MAVDNPAQFTPAVPKAPRIHGVKTKSLRLIPDERGWLMEILRNDDPEFFTKFGQTYASATYPGVVKAWEWRPDEPGAIPSPTTGWLLAGVGRKP